MASLLTILHAFNPATPARIQKIAAGTSVISINRNVSDPAAMAITQPNAEKPKPSPITWIVSNPVHQVTAPKTVPPPSIIPAVSSPAPGQISLTSAKLPHTTILTASIAVSSANPVLTSVPLPNIRKAATLQP